MGDEKKQKLETAIPLMEIFCSQPLFSFFSSLSLMQWAPSNFNMMNSDINKNIIMQNSFTQDIEPDDKEQW